MKFLALCCLGILGTADTVRTYQAFGTSGGSALPPCSVGSCGAASSGQDPCGGWIASLVPSNGCYWPLHLPPIHPTQLSSAAWEVKESSLADLRSPPPNWDSWSSEEGRVDPSGHLPPSGWKAKPAPIGAAIVAYWSNMRAPFFLAMARCLRSPSPYTDNGSSMELGGEKKPQVRRGA